MGWVTEAVAWCDPADFEPGSVPNEVVLVWSDKSGEPVSTRKVVSHQGFTQCEGEDWTNVSYLQIGGKAIYVRDPDGVLADAVRRPYHPDTATPSSAKDTGYRRDGAALHLGEEEAYVVTSRGAELWPEAIAEDPCLSAHP